MKVDRFHHEAGFGMVFFIYAASANAMAAIPPRF